MLKVKNISKVYQGTKGKVHTLEDISLEVNKGEFVSIIGPSGCGKSTLFNIISGLEKPDKGTIFLNNRNITGMRGYVSYMLQKDLLLPWRTVLDNCILGQEIQNIPRNKARELARSVLQEFNLQEYERSYPAVLSGGMRQRVAFLRTILSGKEILLLDEPFGALDAFTKSEMHHWLMKVWEKYNTAVLFITHDVEEALLLSDRIYVFSHRPAKVRLVSEISLKRPRSRDTLVTKEFIEYKKALLETLFYNERLSLKGEL